MEFDRLVEYVERFVVRLLFGICVVVAVVVVIAIIGAVTALIMGRPAVAALSAGVGAGIYLIGWGVEALALRWG